MISRLCGVTLLKPSKNGWFPEEELRAFYELSPHKITWIEKNIFGFKEDGSEGICCPTKPSDNVLEAAVKFDTNVDEDNFWKAGFERRNNSSQSLFSLFHEKKSLFRL